MPVSRRSPRRPELGGLAPVARALELIGDRWSLLVVAALLQGGSMRYGDLGAVLGGIAPNVLAARLRHLEASGLVEAEPYQLRPPRFSYRLTAEGRELADVVGVLSAWAGRRGGGSGDADSPGTDPGRHGVCGTPLEWRPWCPACATVVEPGDDAVWV